MTIVWQSLTRPVMGTMLTLVGGAADRSPDAVATRLRDVADELDDLAARWTRFDPRSDLERLNDDPRPTVPVDPRLGRAVAAALWCRERSGGLVDPTLGTQVRAAGYDRTLGRLDRVEAAAVLELARGRGTVPVPVPRTLPGRPTVTVSADRCSVDRPAGVRIDLGGTAKGYAADLAAGRLGDLDRYSVSVGGDVRIGGVRSDIEQEVLVAAPGGSRTIATFTVDQGAVATSTIAGRAWRTRTGAVAHHLIDPRTGRPAWTGVVQATARARTALEAEVLAKQALLEGPCAGAELLRDRAGGVLVRADGRIDEVIA